LTLLFDEAIKEVDPAERFERLRTIGDGVLYGCGFFADHFAARGVDTHYLHRLGTGAYEAAGSILRRRPHDSGSDLFAELADNFADFVKIVSDVADTTVTMGGKSAGGLLKIYERWLKTGSDRLANALAARGVVPTRGSGGTLQ
jgi:hypothetical protein